MLLAVTQSTQQQSQPHQTIERDHDHGEHRVPRERGIIRAMQHCGGNHRHLDADRGEGQDQRSIRLATFDRETVGMPHNGQGSPKDHHEEPQKDNDQPDWMRNVFHEPISGRVKNSRCSQTDGQRKFGSHRGAKAGDAFRSRLRLLPFRHGREHIQCTRVMQSMDEKSNV